MTNKNIEKIKLAVSKHNPLAVYLFGSQAQNTASVKSDYDVLIITDDRTDSKQMGIKIGLELFPRQFEVELMTYTISDIQHRLQSQNPFFLSIQKTGKLIYGNPVI